MKVREICTSITDGSHNPPRGVNSSPFLMLSSKNVFDDNITLDNPRYLSEESFVQEDKRTNISSGDVLLTIVGTVGRCAVVSKALPRFTLQRSVAVLHPKADLIDSRFLMYSLRGKRPYIENAAKGVAQKGIYLSEVSDIDIPLPSTSEQVHIVRCLDRVSWLLHSREKQLQLLDDLIKARFVEMFGDPVSNPKGWQIKRFDSISENLDSRRKPITASEREAGEYPYYGASGIVDYVADYIFDEDILLVSEDGANLLMRSTPIAFSVSGKVWVNNHAHVVRFNDKGLQKYIEVFFSMIDISDQITGSAQPKLNQAKLNAMLFPIPDKKSTDSFLDFLAQVDKAKAVVQKALEKTQLLFASLMQMYFR